MKANCLMTMFFMSPFIGTTLLSEIRETNFHPIENQKIVVTSEIVTDVKNENSINVTEHELQLIVQEFISNIQAEFRLDDTKKEQLSGYTLPTLKNGDWILSDHPIPLVDSFSKRTAAIATFFIKMGDEFIRESTSLKTEKNKNAAGTILLHDNPAYDALMKGESFTGIVDLFGVKYLSYYDVIRNTNQEVIGAYFIGIPNSMFFVKKE